MATASCMVGCAALQLVTAQVEEQSRKKQSVRIRAEHSYKIVIIDATTVLVDDRYINNNVRLDPDTLEPIEKEPNHLGHRSFTMRSVNGCGVQLFGSRL